MLIMNGILAPPRLWVLDETFDGLDEVSRYALRDELAVLLQSEEWSQVPGPAESNLSHWYSVPCSS